MVRKNGGIYGFLRTSWVLITYNICPPGIVSIDALGSDSTAFDLRTSPLATHCYQEMKNLGPPFSIPKKATMLGSEPAHLML